VTRTQRSRTSWAAELVAIVAVAVGLAFAAQAFVVKPYRIPSASMEPTLQIGQRILVNRVGAGSGGWTVGEIVVFHPPLDYSGGCADERQGQNAAGQAGARPCGVAQARPSSQTFVKRVVGLPGDRISIRAGHVIRNGVRERDPYIKPCLGVTICDFPGTVTIPRGEYFMMGDNRGQSDDSRFWGPVRQSWILGDAFFSYWPPDRLGSL
jgi:signal peptidase I